MYNEKPEDRYQTADELIADLKLVFEDTSGEYVGIVPTIDDSPTIMIDQNELTQRIQTMMTHSLWKIQIAMHIWKRMMRKKKQE